MNKNGRNPCGSQKWVCGHMARSRAAARYRTNHARRLEQFAARYEKHALKILMRAHARYHQQRLVELQQAVTEGGRNGGEVQTEI